MRTETAARELSIPELLQVLREKLDEECSKVRGISRFCEPSVENEVESLETQACDILRFVPPLRNQLRPVNRLPPEIISYIARWVLRIGDGFGVGPNIPLTHVCQYWRDSIVSAPENWTRINSREMALAGLGLERAKAAPLDVEAFGYSFWFFDLLRPHAHQVVTLECLHFGDIEELYRATWDFPKSMINLRSLTISGRRASTWLEGFPDPFDFSTNKALRKLTWSGITFCPSVFGLRTLTEFNLHNSRFNLHLDTLLSFLEENLSLERAGLDIEFANASLYPSQRRHPAKTSLRELTIFCGTPGQVKPLVSSIALQKGGTLEIRDRGLGGLNSIIYGLSAAHPPGLLSPTFMEYQLFPRNIRLVGPSGGFSYLALHDVPLPCFGEEFPPSSFTSIREVRLKCCGSWVPLQIKLSSFPSLEILAVDGHAMGGSDDYSLPEVNSLFNNSPPLSISPVSPDPGTSPSLKTLAFLDCAFTEGFMKKLTWTAFKRRIRSSPSLQRVVIMDSKGKFPSANSIRLLKQYVAVVETLEGKELPKDLS